MVREDMNQDLEAVMHADKSDCFVDGEVTDIDVLSFDLLAKTLHTPTIIALQYHCNDK